MRILPFFAPVCRPACAPLCLPRLCTGEGKLLVFIPPAESLLRFDGRAFEINRGVFTVELLNRDFLVELSNKGFYKGLITRILIVEFFASGWLSLIQ